MRKMLLVTGLLAAAALPAQQPEIDQTVYTTLSQVRLDPDAYRGVRVVFPIQFASLGKLSNPFFTQFTPNEYVNFYGWADEQPIWRKESYEQLFGSMFVAKVHDRVREVYGFKLYQRLKLTAVVRNTFQDQPWIEVLEWEPMGGMVDTATLTHLFRGERHMEGRQWQRAIAELSLVDGDDIPEPALAAVHKNLGLCYLRVGEASRAAIHLQHASDLTGQQDSEVERLLTTAAHRPGAEIDRVIGKSTVKDHERPMWEAFDQEGPTTPTPGPRN